MYGMRLIILVVEHGIKTRDGQMRIKSLPGTKITIAINIR